MPSRKVITETADWPAPLQSAPPLVSPHVVARAVRRLEDATSLLDLAPRAGARALGLVPRSARAD